MLSASPAAILASGPGHAAPMWARKPRRRVRLTLLPHQPPYSAINLKPAPFFCLLPRPRYWTKPQRQATAYMFECGIDRHKCIIFTRIPHFYGNLLPGLRPGDSRGLRPIVRFPSEHSTPVHDIYHTSVAHCRSFFQDTGSTSLHVVFSLAHPKALSPSPSTRPSSLLKAQEQPSQLCFRR